MTRAFRGRVIWVPAIILLVVALIAVMVTTVIVAQGNRVSGIPVAAERNDRDDDVEPGVLDDMPTAPDQRWSVTLAEPALSVSRLKAGSIGGDPLLFLIGKRGSNRPGEVVRLNAYTGERKWTVTMDNPTSCSTRVQGRYLPCYTSSATSRDLRYVDLDTGEVTGEIVFVNRIDGVLPVDDAGAEFLVAEAGPQPGAVTVHRGTPADADAGWTRTYRVGDAGWTSTDRVPGLCIDRERGQGRIGCGEHPGDPVVFNLETGVQEEDEHQPYDENVWTWSERTTIRVDPVTRTFEILNAAGQVVGRGTDAADNATSSRKVGGDYRAVALIGTSAYDTATGAKLWTDARLRQSGSDPLHSVGTAVAAIVNDIVVLRLGGHFVAGSLVGLDLRTGRELWCKSYDYLYLQNFVDSSRWIGVIDGKLRAFETANGEESWSLEYPEPDPDVATRDSYDEARLAKLDDRSLMVITETAVTVYEPR